MHVTLLSVLNYGTITAVFKVQKIGHITINARNVTGVKNFTLFSLALSVTILCHKLLYLSVLEDTMKNQKQFTKTN